MDLGAAAGEFELDVLAAARFVRRLLSGVIQLRRFAADSAAIGGFVGQALLHEQPVADLSGDDVAVAAELALMLRRAGNEHIAGADALRRIPRLRRERL